MTFLKFLQVSYMNFCKNDTNSSQLCLPLFLHMSVYILPKITTRYKIHRNPWIIFDNKKSNSTEQLKAKRPKKAEKLILVVE